MSRPPLLVVNPKSGGGKTERTFPELRRAIEQRLGRCDVILTAERGHAIELARDASAAGYELIVAVGGDGTIHECANGILEASAAARAKGAVAHGAGAVLGVIGQGTGGDYRRSLGILEHRLDKYLDALVSGARREVDVGKLRYRDAGGTERERYFINILSAGLGGLVDRYVADTPRTFGGSAAYFYASMRALANSRPGRVRCTSGLAGTETTRELATYLVAICNGRYFGSKMDIAPMAKLDDGRFEIVTLPATSRLKLAMQSRKIYDASHLRERDVEHFACDRISLELLNDVSDTFLIDVDGEPLGGLPIDVELVPRALTVCHAS